MCKGSGVDRGIEYGYSLMVSCKFVAKSNGLGRYRSRMGRKWVETRMDHDVVMAHVDQGHGGVEMEDERKFLPILSDDLTSLAAYCYSIGLVEGSKKVDASIKVTGVGVSNYKNTHIAAG
jgi:hypothetical protein